MTETMDSATQTYEASDFLHESPMDSIKKMVGGSDSRVEIDTSPPFSSVEEAVIHFGGRGFWVRRPFLDAPPHESEEYDIYKLEEQAADMLNDLNLKEQETLEILKELDRTKRLLQELKLKSQTETGMRNHVKFLECSNSLPSSSAGAIMMELKQAKLNLYQSTSDLAAIRASIESLNKRMEREKSCVEKVKDGKSFSPAPETMVRQRTTVQTNNDAPGITRELRELNYEAEQFMRTAEAARAEVLKAMSDIEQTKSGLKLIEMKWVAAKKLEEAARAAEAVALAEIRAISHGEIASAEGFPQQKPGRISLSLEEYSSLANKARTAESLLRRKDLEESDGNRRKAQAIGSDSGERKQQLLNNRRDSRLLSANDQFHLGAKECKPILRQTTSVGEVLGRNLVARDELDIERREEEGAERQRVSLNQMLHRHRGEASPVSKRNEKSSGEQKQLPKRKTLGFVHISLPLSKQSKSKIQALNFW